MRSLLERSSEISVDVATDPLAVLQVQGTISPGRPELLKRRLLLVRVFPFDEVNVVSGDTLADDDFAGECVAVISDQIIYSNNRAVLEVLESQTSELVIHGRVEVPDQEMCPELVEDVHVVRAFACSCAALNKRFVSDFGIQLIVSVFRSGIDRPIAVLHPEHLQPGGWRACIRSDGIGQGARAR